MAVILSGAKDLSLGQDRSFAPLRMTVGRVMSGSQDLRDISRNGMREEETADEKGADKSAPMHLSRVIIYTNYAAFPSTTPTPAMAAQPQPVYCNGELF